MIADVGEYAIEQWKRTPRPRHWNSRLRGRMCKQSNSFQRDPFCRRYSVR